MKNKTEFYHLVSELFWYMPNGKKQINEASNKVSEDPLINLFIKTDMGEWDSVTFFGGSFNPLHAGHLECLRLCPEKNIVVVPDCSPHKPVSDLDREKELGLLAKSLKDFDCSIYPAFYLKGDPNPTADWIREVGIKEVNFLMGDDSFMNVMKWIRPEELLNRLTKIYVVPRDFDLSAYDKQIKTLSEINPKLEVIILADHSYRGLSSSEIRQKKSPL